LGNGLVFLRNQLTPSFFLHKINYNTLERILDIPARLGKTPCTPAEARRILGLEIE